MTNLNVLKPTLEKGQLINSGGSIVRRAKVDANATAFGAGQFVKISDYDNGLVVTPCTALDDDVYGVVVYDPKNASQTDAHKPNDLVNVTVAFGIVAMEASGALTTGAEVSISADGTKVLATTTNEAVGIVRDADKVDGDIVRIELKSMI